MAASYRGRHAIRRPRWVAAMAAALVALAVAVPLMLGSGPASATMAQRRVTALLWAESQAGKWYCYGGAGPSCYDCSGLVMSAWAHAGIGIPRTTYGMLASSRLEWIPASQKQRGDLAFYGTGHVELVTHRGTFGALHTGARIWWHRPSGWWHPTAYYRIR